MIGVILALLILLITNIMTTSLNILAISGIIIALIYKWDKLFQKAIFWYVLSLALSIVSLIFYESPFTYYITKGYIPYAFFFVVMFVGVFPNDWTISRKIKKVRGILSIIGFILITPHAFLHIFQLYEGINIFGIIAYVLMIPLTIISFKFIKKEIKIKDWNTVQKGAYLIYIALFIHLIWVGVWIDKIVFAVLLTLYVNNKLIKEWKR